MRLGDFSTITDAFRGHARRRPEVVAATFLDDLGEEAGALTYAELDRRALRLAAGLHDDGLAGERVLLLFGSHPDFLAAFLGCLYAGAIPVPVPLPSGHRHESDRIAGIARSSGARLALTTPDQVSAVGALMAEAALPVRCADVGSTGRAGAESFVPATSTSDTVAFLQYTSGSTSAPKGVQVTHGNLAHNIGTIGAAFELTEDTANGGWLPFHHDMGLIGQVLTPLWHGLSVSLISPSTFLRRPYRWLRMISDRRLEISGGPSFAFEMCRRRITDEQLATLDLSHWQVAFTGAEPVRADTLRAFAERFAPAGFRPEAVLPCYGMAEATLMVTIGDRGRGPVVRTVSRARLECEGRVDGGRSSGSADDIALVSCGRPRDLEVTIRDADAAVELPGGRVGEIWVRGASVAPGYFQDPAASAATFDAGHPPDHGWLRTGDLGALLDGELLVTGRLKEMLIINGRNLYPQDIEAEVGNAHEVLAGRASAAFSVDVGGEQAVVIAEVPPHALREITADELAAAVRSHLARTIGAGAHHVVLVRPGTIRRTTSGKIQRRAMRQLYLTEQLLPLTAADAATA